MFNKIIYKTKNIIKYFRNKSNSKNLLNWENSLINKIQINNSFTNNIKFSIILPVYNSNNTYLKKQIHKILKQKHTNFEVCICDDNSSNTKHLEYLKQLSQKYHQFIIQLSSQNTGIAQNTNKCMSMASGDYYILCDHDDIIHQKALSILNQFICENNFPDLLYSDEDFINENDLHFEPRLQGNWDPELLQNHHYFPHLICIKAYLVKKIGEFNQDLSGAQDYDYMLRATEQAKTIIRIPYVLYSWRMHSESISQEHASKLYAYENGRIALENSLSRNNNNAIVIKKSGTNSGTYRVKHKIKNHNYTHILACGPGYILESLKTLRLLDNNNQIVIVADRNRISTDISNSLAKLSNVTVIIQNDYNIARFYNIGAEEAKTDNLIFSSDLLEVLDSDYPNAFLEHLDRPEIGAIGSKIHYPSGAYFHTGIILGINNFCGYAHRNTQPNSGYYNYAYCTKSWSAVSGLFMAVNKNNWKKVNGFDENLNNYYDIDFCLKLRNAGLRNIYTPYISGCIKRSVHRPDEIYFKNEADIIIDRYGKNILNDPYYNQNSSKIREDFSID